MTLILFLLILSILVLVHESGHFIAAKKNGIRVEEFGLGLPPRLLGKKFGETLYSLNLLPFGGFVKLTGEDIEDEDNKDLLEDPRSFISKKPKVRALVLVAGVIMNMVLAVVVFYIFLTANGFRSFELPLFFDYKFKFGEMNNVKTVVTGVEEGYPADTSGVELGEAITDIDGEEINDIFDLRNALDGKEGRDVYVTLKDLKDRTGDSTRTVAMQPRVGPEGEEVIGVFVGEFTYLSYEKPWQKAFSGFLHTYNMSAYSIYAFRNIIAFSIDTGDIEPVSQSVSGPVGIYQLVGGILDLPVKAAVLSMLDYIALMSMSLAIINIMPFPALDGGRIVFVLYEMVRGKRLSPKFETAIHKVGMILLLGLLFLVTIKDIIR